MSNTLILNFTEAGESEKSNTCQYVAVAVPGILFIDEQELLALIGITKRPYNLNITINLNNAEDAINLTRYGRYVGSTDMFTYSTPSGLENPTTASLIIPTWLLWRTLDSKPRRPYNINIVIAAGPSDTALQQNPIGPNIQTPGPQGIGADY